MSELDSRNSEGCTKEPFCHAKQIRPQRQRCLLREAHLRIRRRWRPSRWPPQAQRTTAVFQVWSLTQFYSVDFSKLRIDVKKCVFNKRNQGLRQLLLMEPWVLRALRNTRDSVLVSL